MIDTATPIQIDPAAYYHAGAVALILDVPLATLAQARRRGELRYVRRGRRILIRGEWLIDWLTPHQQEGARRGD